MAMVTLRHDDDYWITNQLQLSAKVFVVRASEQVFLVVLLGIMVIAVKKFLS